MQTHTIWVVTADGGGARFFEQARPGADLVERTELAMWGERPDPARDRLPRTHDRLGPGRHAIEPRQSPQTAAEGKFLKDVAAAINGAADEGAFRKLILCAPPHPLGVLREAMSSAAAERIEASVGKDYLHDTPGELMAHLEKVLR